jgi:hypothetical protein
MELFRLGKSQSLDKFTQVTQRELSITLKQFTVFLSVLCAEASSWMSSKMHMGVCHVSAISSVYKLVPLLILIFPLKGLQ